MAIKSVSDIRDELWEWEDSEREFNKYLLKLLMKKKLAQKVFLEYLEMTQVDVLEAINDCDLID